MSILSRYMAEIGRRGGMKSRRTLAPETARRMVEIREARRAARRAAETASAVRLPGTPADTSAKAQAVQDALVRRMSPGEKLEQVAHMSRMVDQLAAMGLRQRHPGATEHWIRLRQAEERLGRELTAKVYGWLSNTD
jgi:hypothetical protein